MPVTVSRGPFTDSYRSDSAYYSFFKFHHDIITPVISSECDSFIRKNDYHAIFTAYFVMQCFWDIVPERLSPSQDMLFL